eukprot:364205-Chlamydomonas_euryale.AAC.2
MSRGQLTLPQAQAGPGRCLCPHVRKHLHSCPEASVPLPGAFSLHVRKLSFPCPKATFPLCKAFRPAVRNLLLK